MGAGRLGRTLGLATQAAGFELLGTWNRTPATARATRRLLSCKASSGRLPPRIREADLVLLCVGDDAIEAMAGRLADEGRVGPGQVVAHCAGALDLSGLAACAELGASVGSMHPLRAFVDPRRDQARLPGTLAVIDGDPLARERLGALARALGLRGATLNNDPRSRARYHAAAVSVAGNLCALVDGALELADGAGLSQDDALAGLLALARGVLDAIECEGETATALTGPVARGDEGVIQTHREAMRGLSPDLLTIYDALIARSRRLIP